MGYMYDEALGFFIEYLSLYEHTRRRMWDLEEEVTNVGEVFRGEQRRRLLMNNEIKQTSGYPRP
jgi:hypothetical protein